MLFSIILANIDSLMVLDKVRALFKDLKTHSTANHMIGTHNFYWGCRFGGNKIRGHHLECPRKWVIITGIRPSMFGPVSVG